MKADRVFVGAEIIVPCGCCAVVTAVSRTLVRCRITRATGCRRSGRRHIAGIDWDDCPPDAEVHLLDPLLDVLLEPQATSPGKARTDTVSRRSRTPAGRDFDATTTPSTTDVGS